MLLSLTTLMKYAHDVGCELEIKLALKKTELVTNCGRFANLKHSSSFPYAFTEQGVALLSAATPDGSL